MGSSGEVHGHLIATGGILEGPALTSTIELLSVNLLEAGWDGKLPRSRIFLLHHPTERRGHLVFHPVDGRIATDVPEGEAQGAIGVRPEVLFPTLR